MQKSFSFFQFAKRLRKGRVAAPLKETGDDVEKNEETKSNCSSPKSPGTPIPEKTVCLFTESPYHILKVAAQGNLEEVQRLVEEDNERLDVRDYRGQNVFHHAASWSRLAVLDYLHQFVGVLPQADMNVRDKLGNTPLHFALERRQQKAVKWFIEHGANLTIKNNNSAAPIHSAIEQNNLDAVKMTIEIAPELIDLPGDFGFTPLQYACARDLPEIARYLLDSGADMFMDCEIGYSAIHAATRNGSAKAVAVLIEFAEKKGISGESLIHTLDKEKNFPLHSAVNSGDLKAVKVCLEAGANINAQHSEDKQSAIHYAAAKGSKTILSMIFEAQPETVESCLHSRDILEQTPLHKAAMFNHVGVVELLLENGASMNPQDSDRRTPLILAASKGATNAVNFLLNRRANINLKDKDNRNFLHMAILTGLKLKELNLSMVRNVKQLLNERDDFGCCPVHYASRAGQLITVKHLVKLGAEVTLKDNEKQSPLHFAAQHGRLRTCKNLLNSENGALLINEVDGDGRTPMLIAAMFGHHRVIALLVRKGAQMSKDFQQNTALHLAAEHGNYDAVVILIGLAPHLVNAINSAKNTPLHLAAANGHSLIVDYLMTADARFEQNADEFTFIDLAITKVQPDATAAIIRHQRCEEAMNLPSPLGSPLIALIQHLPKICILFLDKCITFSADNKKSPNFCIQYNFRYLFTPDNLLEKEKASENLQHNMPMLPLNMMVKYNRVECLAHPLCVTFLNKKWTSYGSLIYNLRIAIYLLFLGLLTSVAYDVDKVVSLMSCDERCRLHQLSANGTSSMANSSSTWSLKEQMEAELSEDGLVIRMILVTLFCAIDLLFQLFAIAQQKIVYFSDFTHYMELALYITTFLMTIPSIITFENVDLQFTASVISLFLGWMNLLLYMQRFEFFGIYIVMFVEIFKTVIRVFIVFSFILVAFALTLTVVFRTAEGPTIEFRDPMISLLATLSMMLGELNFVQIISPTLNGKTRLLYPELAYIFFVIFIILIPILLTNLLVGLAVGNIESVQKNARLKRLAMKVEFFTALERRLPRWFLRKRLAEEFKFYPNKTGHKFLAFVRNAFTNSSGSNGDAVGGDDNDGAGGDESDFTYLLEELTMQSRQLGVMGSKFDIQQDLLKVILHKVDYELFSKGKLEEKDKESDNENNAADLKETDSKQDSTEFRSATARAQWHAVTTRFAALRRPKSGSLWKGTEEDDKDWEMEDAATDTKTE